MSRHEVILDVKVLDHDVEAYLTISKNGLNLSLLEVVLFEPQATSVPSRRLPPLRRLELPEWLEELVRDELSLRGIEIEQAIKDQDLDALIRKQRGTA